jgi:hypothetical protein
MTSLNLNMLFDRLAWPSCSVKERAAVAIAELLTNELTVTQVTNCLLHWISTQQMESLTAYGLLPVVKAQAVGARFQPAFLSDLRDSVRQGSILAWLLLGEIAPEVSLPIDQFLAHGPEVPQSFTPPPFFGEHAQQYLPPIYLDVAENLESASETPFVRQWAYEWVLLLQRIGMEATEKGGNYWISRSIEGVLYGATDPVLSEVYRSTYLRTLARMITTRSIDENEALELAAQTCPLDLELWKLLPRTRPDWWPKTTSSDSRLDTGPSDIWKQVEELWQKHAAGNSFVQGDLIGSEWAVAAASGFVGGSDTTIYHLEIFGALQRCLGGSIPEAIETVSALSGENGQSLVLPLRGQSLLRMQGIVPVLPPEAFARRIGDWQVLPLTCKLHLTTTPRWQSWRFWNNPLMPAPWFAQSPCEIGCSDGFLTTRCAGSIAGRWVDWTDGLTEKHMESIPPNAGQMLLMPRRLLADLAAKKAGTLCWACRLTSHTRQEHPRKCTAFADCRVLGASRIVATE